MSAAKGRNPIVPPTKPAPIVEDLRENPIEPEAEKSTNVKGDPVERQNL